MFHSKLHTPRHFMALALVLLTTTPVSSQELLEEIIVSADFRERAAADLPPSISVLDAHAIESQAIQHFEELLLAVPNLNYSGDGNRACFFQIRGVGELEQYEGAPNPSVGFLIDDIDFSGAATIATLFDIEQIDVLRGPQGTRYGANALAGLVYMKSADPTPDWNGVLRLTVGDDDTSAAGFAVGGPIVDDTLSFRVAAQQYEGDGFRDNPYLGRDDTNGRSESVVRGKLLWQPTSDWRVLLTGFYADADDGYDGFALDNSMTTLSDEPGRDAQRSLAGSLRADWSGSDKVVLTSITSAVDSSIDFSFDADWGNPEAWDPFTYNFVSVNDRKRRVISQELRLASGAEGRVFNDSTDWLVGVYGMRLADDLKTLNQGDYVDPVYNYALSINDYLVSDFEALSTALFGELEFSSGENGTVSIGLRAEHRATDYHDSSGLALGPSETLLGGELKYRHRFSAQHTGFVTLSRGYKAGGFNLGLVPADRREFEEEALWNFEVGHRSTWLDQRLQLNSVLFYNRRENQQVRTSFQINPNDPASFVFFTDNAASGRSLGAETDIRFDASDAWSFYLTAGLLNAEFEEFITPQVNLSGREQAHAPGYTLSAGSEWRHPTGVFARLDIQARDAFYFDVSHDEMSQPYELVNARLGFQAERWRVQLWARNVLDERYAVRGFYFGNEPPDFPSALYVRQGDPRQLGVTFDASF